MHKKYYIAIIISHLAVVTSLFFPVLRVDDIRLGLTGGTTKSAYLPKRFYPKHCCRL